MRRIVLHVGTHKTGSTSIQQTLNHFRSELQAAGVALYPGSNHTDFHRAFVDTPESFHQYYRGWHRQLHAAETRAQIRDWIRTTQAPNLLVSAEDLSLLSTTGLRTLRDFLQRDCGVTQIEVVCVVREPLDYLNSSLQQFIKPGLTALHDFLHNDFGNYRLQGCPTFGGGMLNILEQLYFPIPSRLLDVFGHERVHFLRFADVTQQGLTRSLLERVLPGQPLPWLQELRYNEAMSHEACMLLAEYNDRQPLLHEDGRLNRWRNRDKHLVPLLRAVPGRKAQLLDNRRLDLAAINQSIGQINAMTGTTLMTPVTAWPAGSDGTQLLEFSAASLAHLAGLIGSEHLPPSADAVRLEPAQLTQINQQLERRSLGQVRVLARALLQRLGV